MIRIFPLPRREIMPAFSNFRNVREMVSIRKDIVEAISSSLKLMISSPDLFHRSRRNPAVLTSGERMDNRRIFSFAYFI